MAESRPDDKGGETPRTDALDTAMVEASITFPESYLKMFDHARQLERELADERERADMNLDHCKRAEEALARSADTPTQAQVDAVMERWEEWCKETGLPAANWRDRLSVSLRSATAPTPFFKAPYPLPAGLGEVLAEYDLITAKADRGDPEWDFVMRAADYRVLREFIAKLERVGPPVEIKNPPRPA